VAIWESFKKLRKFLFLANLFITRKKQGILATGYSFSKKYFFTKRWKINSPQKEEEDCKQVPMDDRPFGYKPKNNPWKKKRKTRCDSYLLPTSPTHYLAGFLNYNYN
jgi:hypothetical protein